MLATGTVVDLGDAVANGIALFAAVVSIIALFVADSRASEANSIALDANETARAANTTARAAHERTVDHYNHIELLDAEKDQREFKAISSPFYIRLRMFERSVARQDGQAILKFMQESHDFLHALSVHLNGAQTLALIELTTLTVNTASDLIHSLERATASLEQKEEVPLVGDVPELALAVEDLENVVKLYSRFLTKAMYGMNYNVAFEWLGRELNTRDIHQENSAEV